jgi:hypothetical protein
MRTLRLVALVGILAACSSSDEPAGGSGSTTTLSGSLAATDGRTGSLTLTGQAPSASVTAAPTAVSASVRAIVTLTGTVSLSDGTTATLTGTWDNVTGALSVTGGGFTFSGTLLNGALSGSFTGPSITGVFSLRVATTATGADVYCGTFTGRTPEDHPSGGTGLGPDNGTWNLVVGASTVDVIVLTDDGSPLVLGGTRSGSTVTITIPGGTATGTISGASSEFVKGTYSAPGPNTGTFQGSKAACTATAETATPQSMTINNPGVMIQNQSGRLVMDSVLVHVTAWDAAGNHVAAPNLTWTFTGPVRSNNAVTPRGTKWFVPTSTGSTSVTARSVSNTAAAASATVIIY